MNKEGTMNYNRRLYEATAWLLMLQEQMPEYPFSTVVARFFDDRWDDSKKKAVDYIAILLALERTGAPMCADTIDELESGIAALSPEDFSENDRAYAEADLKTAKSVIDWYRNTAGKLK